MFFHPNIRHLTIERGIVAGLTPAVGVTVFNGVRPAASFVVENWNTQKENALVHWVGVGWTVPLNGIMAAVTTFPTPTPALRTGTAEWAIIWSTNITAEQIAGVILPSTSFIICPVSDLVGSGVVRLETTSIEQGVSTALGDGSITVSST